MYYRLYDTQTGCYLATGYNDKSKKDLKESYLSYKSVDWDSEETEAHYKNLTTREIFTQIAEDDFVIEESKIKFDESENPMNCF
jgi:hypothetical protein